MDIHKPKALHNWRDFLKEIGTIIVGILLALAFEAVVGWARTGRDLRQAREALRAELGQDAANLKAMAAEARCADARLKLLEDWGAGKVKIDSANLASMENRPLFYSLQASAWDVTKSGAVAARMPVRERLAYASVYDSISNQMVHIIDERHAWDLLARYAGRSSLDAAEAKALTADIASVRIQDAGLRFNTPDLLDEIAKLGVKPAAAPPRDPTLLCRPPR